jgi:hypothetical protein
MNAGQQHEMTIAYKSVAEANTITGITTLGPTLRCLVGER